jgi:hypothetical protein
VGGVHAGFWWGSQKEADRREDIDVGRRIILKLKMTWYGLDSSGSG